jgi:hypothetical protein
MRSTASRMLLWNSEKRPSEMKIDVHEEGQGSTLRRIPLGAEVLTPADDIFSKAYLLLAARIYRRGEMRG